MKQQTLRNCWENSKGAINAWCSIPNTVTAEMMSMNDFDSITIDMQHGLVDYQAALNMLQVISGSGKTPMVRVPWNEPGIIMKALDAGALGIICPMINTPEDATSFVGATKYAPLGYRSSGPTRAMMVHGSSYHDEANDNIISCLSSSGMKNLILPKNQSKLIIAVDNDKAGVEAGEILADRAIVTGFDDVKTIKPPVGNDFNDFVQAKILGVCYGK